MNKTFNIYCDESCHLEHDGIKPMLLGCVWCAKEEKNRIFSDLRELKIKHGLSPRCELKWNAVSPSKIDYYRDVLNYFFAEDALHFRVLVVPDKQQLNHDVYGQTHDQFYYKMYFDLLKTIISPIAQYNVYMDKKDTHGGRKLRKLHDVLSSSQYDFDNQIIQQIEQVDSWDVELVELTDFLMGAVAYVHRGLTGSATKLELIEMIRQRTGYSLVRSTLYQEQKFNIFIWKGRVNG